MTLTRPEPINMMTLPLSTRDAGNDAATSRVSGSERDSGNLLFSIHEEIRPQIDFGADAAHIRQNMLKLRAASVLVS